MYPGRFLVKHHIGAIRVDNPAKLTQHVLQSHPGLGRRAVDQTRRILGDDVFKCCPPPQCHRPCPKPKAENHEHDEQQQGGNVEQQPIALLGGLDHGPMAGKQFAGLLQGLGAGHGDKGLQRFIDGGELIMEQPRVRQHRARCFCLRSGGGRLLCKLVDPFPECLESVG